MKLLVTGADGFIGRHLSADLEAAGHEVKACDLVDGDIRDRVLLQRLIAKHEPDRVVHLAAAVGRLRRERDPVETVSVNVGGTAAIAWACGEEGVPLTYASSSEVYGNGGWSIWREDQLYKRLPHNAYGLTKRQGEEFAALYAPDGLQIACICMPYGPGSWPGWGRTALINFLNWALRREPLIVHRGAERSWCYIEDTVRAMRLLIESDETGRWNIGRDDDLRPLEEVAEMACELAGADRSLIQVVDPPERYLSVIKRISTSRLYARFGWQPEVELFEGMARTLDWLKVARA